MTTIHRLAQALADIANALHHVQVDADEARRLIIATCVVTIFWITLATLAVTP